MRQVQRLAFNTLLLTSASFFMQAVGVVFQVYLTAQIGAEGIGLWQLTMAVYALAVNLAISGVRFAATRLVAEELGLGIGGGVRTAMTRCLWYAALFGGVSGFILWWCAPFLAGEWIGDLRCVLPLRVLAPGLPFLSMGAALGGYFTAVQRVVKAAAAQSMEQFVRIGVIILIFWGMAPQGLDQACAAVAAGSAAGELCSLAALWALYRLDRRRISRGLPPPSGRSMTRRLLHTALPVAFSSYARTALSTLQNLLIPRGLKKAGASSQGAFSSYGVIHGMVFPIIFFPSALLTALAELLIPELTRSQVAGQRARVDYMIGRVFGMGILFSFGVSGIIWGFSQELGIIIYKNPDAARYIRVFAPLIPVMYMDTLTDGMLKGLGEQVASMRYNIIDSLCSVILVYLLLPRFAIGGYLFTVWFTEVLNFALSVGKLLRISGLKISLWGNILRPAGCVISAAIFVPPLSAAAGLPGATGGSGLALQILLALAVYFVLLCLTGAFTRQDAAWLLGLLLGRKKQASPSAACREQA